MPKGYIIIKTVTSNAKIPISNSEIIMYLDEEKNLLGIRESNRSGLTEVIEVETPDKGLSTKPSDKKPFTTCTIHVSHNEYYNVVVKDVQIFPDTTSIQEIHLIPLEENAPTDSRTKTFVVTPQNL